MVFWASDYLSTKIVRHSADHIIDLKDELDGKETSIREQNLAVAGAHREIALYEAKVKEEYAASKLFQQARFCLLSLSCDQIMESQLESLMGVSI